MYPNENGDARDPSRIGKGCTAFQCGLDTDYHGDMAAVILDLEQADFAVQQEERPWKVPCRDRQCLADDMVSIFCPLGQPTPRY